MTFVEKVRAIARRNQSWLCVGLDSEFLKLPPLLRDHHGREAVFEFNKAIIEATADLVCAYKPNLAFYEMLGPQGLDILQRTRELVPKEIPVIADAKRGDVENTARAYSIALFDYYRFDAATVNPLMGADSVAPFLERTETCAFLLVRTSNVGARDFQDINCEGKSLYQRFSEKAREWNTRGNVGVVVGATAPQELAIIRKIIGNEMPILIPGVGVQAGDLETAVKNGMNAHSELAIMNASRSVIFASSDSGFARTARNAALRLRNAINRSREEINL